MESPDLARWLLYEVDGATSHSCNEITKLGMRTELTQGDLDSARSISDLYFLLERRNIYKKKGELVARFIYALKLLDRKRMNDAIAKIPPELKPSTPFDPLNQTQEFQFHQILVRVCIGLRHDKQQSQRVINYICSHVCGMSTSPRYFRSGTHTLMLKLIHRGLIISQDQTVLVEGLVVVRAYNCIKMIQNYRLHNGLPKMDLEAIEKKVHLTILG